MPTKPVKRFTAWSYSRLGDYNACPLRAKLKHLDRIPEPGSPAMDRGAKIHEAAAAYIKGGLLRLPAELKLFKKEFAAVRKQAAVDDTLLVEGQWAFTSTWKATGWFDRDAWCRMVLDLGHIKLETKKTGLLTKGSKTRTLRVVDYKTGRVRADEQRSQLSLYALGGFIMAPDVDVVETEFWYIDHGEIADARYERAQLPELKKEWQGKVAPLFKDTKFAPRPGNACRWCHFSKAKGGSCQY